MKTPATTLLIGLTASSAVGSAEAFNAALLRPRRSPRGVQTNRNIRRVQCRVDGPATIILQAKKSGPGAVHRPENEFSRRYRTETVLPGGRAGRDYKVSIEATEEERAALATRFRLSEIARLEADVILRRDRSGSAYDSDCIHIDGTVLATVSQKCVRTNEDFDVNLEFDVSAAVRPAQSTETNDDADMEEIERALGGSVADIGGSGGGGGGGGGRRNNKRGGKRNNNIRADASIDDVGLKALQDMLADFDVEEDVVEDESVLGQDGYIDVGELVAQLFRLKLDPYPKKPGSEPINLSFSG